MELKKVGGQEVRTLGLAPMKMSWTEWTSLTSFTSFSPFSTLSRSISARIDSMRTRCSLMYFCDEVECEMERGCEKRGRTS